MRPSGFYLSKKAWQFGAKDIKTEERAGEFHIVMKTLQFAALALPAAKAVGLPEIHWAPIAALIIAPSTIKMVH